MGTNRGAHIGTDERHAGDGSGMLAVPLQHGASRFFADAADACNFEDGLIQQRIESWAWSHGYRGRAGYFQSDLSSALAGQRCRRRQLTADYRDDAGGSVVRMVVQDMPPGHG